MLSDQLDTITPEILRNLVDQRVHEGRATEFKQDLWRLDTKLNTNPADVDKQRIEFLKDISSFANADGGHLIVGMQEEDGMAKELLGITTMEHEAWRSRLDQLLQNWIEPRIRVSMKFIQLETKKHALVFYVSPSLIGPHRVTYNDSNQFFSRNSTGAYAMSTDELRSAFTRTLALADRIREFRESRVQFVETKGLPVHLEDAPRLILHIIPQESFTSLYDVSIEKLKLQQPRMKPPGCSYTPFFRPNLDGYLVHTAIDEGRRPTQGYTQVFRNGIVEAAFTGISFQRAQGQPLYWSPQAEASVMNVIPDYLQCITELGLSPPAWIFITLTRVQKVRFPSEMGGSHAFDRNHVQLPEHLISDFGLSAYEILRPIFDQIWNAAGFEKCHRLNDKGEVLRLHMDHFV